MFLYCNSSALRRLGPLATYRWCHERSSLFVLVENQPKQSKKNFITQMLFPRETENSLLLYLLRRISNFPICLPQMGFWKYGNAEDSIDCVPLKFYKLFVWQGIYMSFLNLQKFVNDPIAPLLHTCPIVCLFLYFFYYFIFLNFFVSLKCIAMPLLPMFPCPPF